MLTRVAIADLRPTDEVLELRARVRAFMEEHVYPNEPTLNREDDEADALVERLRGARARSRACGRRTCRPRPAARAGASSSTRS